MTSKPLTIGFKEEWKVFFDNHPLWPEKYKLLTSTLTKIFIRKAALNSPADRVVFHLGRLCVEDFNEIFFLSGNGYGIGGLKILRGLYERAVSLGYIADNPNQAEPFLEYHHIQKGKMINHARPPAELAVFTTDASSKPNPRDVNATKNGIKNNKNIFALESKVVPNNKLRRSIVTICIAATINCENKPDNNIVERETGVVIRRCNVRSSLSSAKWPANWEINTIGAKMILPGAKY